MTSQTLLRITPPTGLQANIDVMNDFIYPNIMGITRQALLLLRKFMKKRRKLSLLRWINMKISLVRMIGWWANVSPKWISVSSQHLYILTLFIIDISNAISAASLTISITGITPSAFTISLALLLRLTLSILKTLLRQPQDHQSYKYRFCRTRFVLTSLKRDTEKFKT